MNIGACRSCGSQVLWARTVNDKPMPLNPEPCEYGGNIVLENGVARVIKKGEAVGHDVKLYRSHFATCKEADKFRKGKK